MPQDLDVFSSFEEFNPNSAIGQIIVVGPSPTTAEFSGDAFAGQIGNLVLYHTGFRSWMVVENGMGVIDFVTTDAATVEFWARVHPAATGNTVITAFDAFDVIVDGPVTIIPITGWQLVSLTGSIARIDVVNLDANEMNAIDDFGFTPARMPTATPTATPTPAPPANRVFVTSATTDGDLGGIAGADATCNGLASSAGLGGSWVAWLSTTTLDAVDRLTPGSGPFVRAVDGTKIADDIADLTDGSLDVAIEDDENGTNVGSDPVWTATAADGLYKGTGDCNGWTSNSSTFRAEIGNSGSSTTLWTTRRTRACDFSTARLYCFEFGEATATPTATPTATATATPTATPTPEPSGLTALGSGIAMLALLYRRRGRRRVPLGIEVRP